MISEKTMLTNREEICPISEDSIKTLVDLVGERAETINAKVSNICEFLNAEAFKMYISNSHERTEVVDLRTQVARLVEVTESSAELIDIIMESLGM